MENQIVLQDFLKGQKRLGELYACAMEQAAQKCGLSRPEADVLVFLHNNPLLNTAADFVKYRGFSKAYVSKAIDGLGAKKMILVQADACDRRYQRIQICEAAGEAVQVLSACQKNFFARLTADFTPQEHALLYKLFGRLASNAEKITL